MSNLTKDNITNAWAIVTNNEKAMSSAKTAVGMAKSGFAPIANAFLATVQEAFNEALLSVTTKDVYGDLVLIENEDSTYRLGCYDKNDIEISLYNDHDNYSIDEE